MRQINLHNAETLAFEVSNDPQQIIAQFLTAALNDPDHLHKEIAELLVPDGDGYYIINNFNAFIIEDSEELPPDQNDIWVDLAKHNADIWLIAREDKHHKNSIALLMGNEIRYLFERACHLLYEAEMGD